KSIAGEVYEESLVGVKPEARRVLVEGLEAMVRNLTDDETPSIEKVKNTEGAAA
ncbi:MarR family transcriptional regulator, partial [Mesorhizobium sp. M7A.F.Ca.CA.001.14.1.1]